MFYKVKSVTPQPNFRLLVHFCCGTAKEYDAAPLFAQVDGFQALRDIPGLFEQVCVDAGGYGISWNDELDLSCNELWSHGQSVSTPA